VQRRVGSRGGGDPPAANAAPSGVEEEGRQQGREHGLRVAGEGELHGRQGLAEIVRDKDWFFFILPLIFFNYYRTYEYMKL
jgi:hypothetical protein